MRQSDYVRMQAGYSRMPGPDASTLKARHQTHIFRPRTDEVPGRVLFHRVADPADAAADSEEDERRAFRQPEHTGRGRERKVEIGLLTGCCRDDVGESCGVSEF